MAKTALKYLAVQPWAVTEKGFHPERNRVSESIFSLGNEYMGVRGFAEEGCSASSLIGSYFNGVYENAKKINETAYKGIVKRGHFMVNSVNWLYTELSAAGVKLDTATCELSEYERTLDFKSGVLSRTFQWHLGGEKRIKLCFERFLSMTDCRYGYQTISVQSNFDGELSLRLGLDFSVLHWGKDCYWRVTNAKREGNTAYLEGQTLTTGQRVLSAMELSMQGDSTLAYFEEEKRNGFQLILSLKKDTPCSVTKFVTNLVSKEGQGEDLLQAAKPLIESQAAEGYPAALNKNKAYWERFWEQTDIKIEGDPENQQGIRFCIFQLQQTYHGYCPKNNIGAKGLTGEAYSGHAFWDTETYCLPFYLFNNQKAALDLLLYRYHTLDAARKRAAELDCNGAAYPIATLNGNEACDLWQHASLQLQPGTAVAYGIFHYINLTEDYRFLAEYGLEMLIEIGRFLLARGAWDYSGKHFSFYCVMGPDEFQMMVNHNSYTNFMAKKTFAYLKRAISMVEERYPDALKDVLARTGFQKSELEQMGRAESGMKLLYDETTQLFEQHAGYYELPHIDVDEIPDVDFPLYHHWSYDRIYRNDMIKQPDVLMFQFLYASQFSLSCKRANYEFYEPRCIHESSLSPSVHSILAAELGKDSEALDFFAYATRMDLDDYNRNSAEGLHTTSIAAAWMNIVYGFGGLRSDGTQLSLAPTIPSIWKRYSFKINYRGATVYAEVEKSGVWIKQDKDTALTFLVYGKPFSVTKEAKFAERPCK